jgi:SAM-dependent methyltransferase
MRGSTRSSDWRAMRATDLSSSDYETFAPYYDGFTASSDYEVWTAQVLQVAQAHGLAGRALLDVACGTGNSFIPFLNRGFSVTGCDRSHAMLAEAARKAPDATLVEADMRELTMLGRFDLVTCFEDSLNYLRDEDELLGALHGIAANLARSGVALFDLNTLRAYRTTFARDSVAERDGVVYAWRGRSSADLEPGGAAVAEIEVFAPRGAHYERISSAHEQRHFPLADVTALVESAGLRCAAVHGVLDDGSLVEHADEERHLKSLFIATHAKGGDAQ